MKQGSMSAEDVRFLKKVGSRIRSIRNEKGWTLEQVEEHGWKDWTHLQKIESGKNITIVTLRRVGQLFKMPVSKLLEGL